jgi:MOSC domain-containing protein YiiM
MAHVQSIAFTPADIERTPAERYARISCERAALVAGRGIAGDVKARPGKRQLNVMLAQGVARLRDDGYRTAPGELGEQLVIAGLEEGAVEPGMRLRIGDTAIIQLGKLRTPCARFAGIQGFPAAAARERIGFMARVVVGGEFEIGSPVVIEEHRDDVE